MEHMAFPVPHAGIPSILRTSEIKHGQAARIRDCGLLTATMRQVADDPQGLLTLDRNELLCGLRSL
jgi:hypothetical protein